MWWCVFGELTATPPFYQNLLTPPAQANDAVQSASLSMLKAVGRAKAVSQSATPIHNKTSVDRSTTPTTTSEQTTSQQHLQTSAIQTRPAKAAGPLSSSAGPSTSFRPTARGQHPRSAEQTTSSPKLSARGRGPATRTGRTGPSAAEAFAALRAGTIGNVGALSRTMPADSLDRTASRVGQLRSDLAKLARGTSEGQKVADQEPMGEVLTLMNKVL